MMIGAIASRGHAGRAGEGNSLSLRGERVSLLLNGKDTGGRFAVVETVEQKGTEAPCSIHTREDLAVYVVEGLVRFCVDGEWHQCTEGTLVHLPKSCEYTYTAESQMARLLVILIPAGFEGYYREMDDGDGASEAAASDFERLVTVAARYGVEITVPSTVDRPDPPSDDKRRGWSTRD